MESAPYLSSSLLFAVIIIFYFLLLTVSIFSVTMNIRNYSILISYCFLSFCVENSPLVSTNVKLI